MKTGKRVLIIGSYAPSLVQFRGPLIAAIVARGHHVDAAAPAIDLKTADALRRLGAEAVEVDMVNSSLDPRGMLRSLRRLAEVIRRSRPDVLISYTIKPVILAALAGRAQRVPHIVSMITGAGYAFTPGCELKRIGSRVAAILLYKVALSRSDVVIFQNGDDEALFRRHGLLGSRQQVRRINGSGVDLEHFAPAPQPTQLSFLMIARLLKDKGIREFAEAAKNLKAAYPHVAVKLVGYLDPSPDSLTKSELDDLIRCGVEYLGKLDDVRPAIAGSSVYVLPSYREGTPRSVLEAMAMGRAVITTDAPGCRETVVDGVNGFLVPPRNAEALLAAMTRFVHDPQLARTMGPHSRRIVEEKYDVHAVNAVLLDMAGLA